MYVEHGTVSFSLDLLFSCNTAFENFMRNQASLLTDSKYNRQVVSASFGHYSDCWFSNNGSSTCARSPKIKSGLVYKNEFLIYSTSEHPYGKFVPPILNTDAISLRRDGLKFFHTVEVSVQ